LDFISFASFSPLRPGNGLASIRSPWALVDRRGPALLRD
jgi:hypothetical protein